MGQLCVQFLDLEAHLGGMGEGTGSAQPHLSAPQDLGGAAQSSCHEEGALASGVLWGPEKSQPDDLLARPQGPLAGERGRGGGKGRGGLRGTRSHWKMLLIQLVSVSCIRLCCARSWRMWPIYAESMVDLGWESRLRAPGSPPASGVLEPQGAAGECGADEPSGLEPFGSRGQWQTFPCWGCWGNGGRGRRVDMMDPLWDGVPLPGVRRPSLPGWLPTLEPRQGRLGCSWLGPCT